MLPHYLIASTGCNDTLLNCYVILLLPAKCFSERKEIIANGIMQTDPALLTFSNNMLGLRLV